MRKTSPLDCFPSRRDVLRAASAGLGLAGCGLLPYALAGESDAPGGLLRITSPDPATFNDIVLPAHRGLVREGLQATAHLERYPLSRNDRPVHAHLLNVNSRMSMLRLRVVADRIDTDLLKETFDLQNGSGQLTAGKYEDPDQFQINQKAMTAIYQLAVAQLSDAGVNRYLIGEKSTLRPGASNWGIRSRGSALVFGGVGANLFERRRAFFDFVDKQVPVLTEWSKEAVFANEFYVVSSLRLPTYQFDLGGFIFGVSRLASGTGAGHELSKKRISGAEQQYATPGAARARPRTGVLVKVAEAEAERLTNEYRNTPLFSLYRARAAAEMEHVYTPIQFQQTMVSESIGIFADAELTNPLFSVPL